MNKELYLSYLSNEIRSEYIKYKKNHQKYYNLNKKYDDDEVWHQAAEKCFELNLNANTFIEKAIELSPAKTFFPRYLTNSKVINRIKFNLKKSNDVNMSVKDYVDFYFQFFETLIKNLTKKQDENDKLKFSSYGGIKKFILKSNLYKLPAWLRMCMAGNDVDIKERYKDQALNELKKIYGLKEFLEIERHCDMSWSIND